MNRSKIFAFAMAMAFGLAAPTGSLHAQDITLPTPQKNASAGSLSKALQDRKSTRQFANTPLTDQQQADLLWAACGINRADGRLTAPTARNLQDITVYVGRPDGTFRYDAKANKLVKVGSGDLRLEAAKRNKFIASAPLVLVIASDTSVQGGRMDICGIDAGAVMQNVYLHCAASGLATVCCYAGEDTSAMQKFLGVKAELKPLICMPVGLPQQ